MFKSVVIKNAYQRKYYKSHIEKMREYARNYYAEHREGLQRKAKLRKYQRYLENENKKVQ